MQRVILCPNPCKDKGYAVTRQVRDLLEGAGYAVSVSPELLDGAEAALPEDLSGCELIPALADAVLVVSLGGDGTIMHTASRLLGHEVPIIGVNLGNVGFLAELERGEIHRLLDAARGDYRLSPRMMLRVRVERGGETVYSAYALNDVFLRGLSRMISMSARSDGRKILDFSGDGVVIASPTGSTAYSMSAGGPLVEPTAENIILTPICPHALAARSLVFTSDRVITVSLGQLRGKAVLSADGGTFEVFSGDILRVDKAQYRTMIAHVGDKAFYDIVYEKLGDTK